MTFCYVVLIVSGNASSADFNLSVLNYGCSITLGAAENINIILTTIKII